MYDNIFKPIKIRNLEIKNRVVFAPTSMAYDKETYIEKLINMASGEVGLIVIGDIAVVDSFHNAIPTLSNDENIESLKRITDEVHKYGCKISAQLFHTDYDVKYIRGLMKLKDTSREHIRDMMKASTVNYVNDMSRDEIDNIQNSFVKAAIRAKKAGFDMIQVHGDRLLGSFSSSIFNKREDEYGGNTENRARMSKEIVEKIRAELPEMPIDYKLGIRKENPDIGKGGPTVAEVGTFVSILDKAGVDSFHVTIANHSLIKDTVPMINHPHLKGEGCFLDLAREVRKYTKKIICLVGKLSTPEFINDILEDEVDMVGLSRQLIADDKWVIKVKEGRAEDIDYCRFCNVKCVDALMNRTPFGCVLHNN